MPRHAWWRGERADVASTGALASDMAGSAASPILARRRRAIHHSAAEKNRERPLGSMRRDVVAHRLLVEMISLWEMIFFLQRRT